MEFDHLFIAVGAAATEADALLAAGFTEGPANMHPGQGTANRSFFFKNGFIEFLFETDRTELQSERTGPTRLYERLNGVRPAVSPFGVCFRPSPVDNTDQTGGLPFLCWRYQPDYLPDHLTVNIADTPLAEPMWFYLEFAQRPDSLNRVCKTDLQHPNGVLVITDVCITVPVQGVLSEQAGLISKSDRFSLLQGDDCLAEVEFDDRKQGRCYDLRPEIPLVLYW